MSALQEDTRFGALVRFALFSRSDSSRTLVRVTHSCLLIAAWNLCGCDRASRYASQQSSSRDLSTHDKASFTDVPDKPRVVCHEAVWDFGTVDNTKTPTLSHRFTLENVLDELVKVDKVEPECGCIVASDFVPEIPGNSKVDLPLTINLAGPPRPFSKRVTVYLGTSPPSRLALGIRGTIDATPAFYSAPSTTDFGTLAGGEKRSRVVKVVRYDANAVKFVRGVPQSNALSLQNAVSADDADSVVELTLSLDASGLRIGDFASSIHVQTDHATHPEFDIPAQARIAGESDGLVRSIFARKLSRGAFQELPLTSEAGSTEVQLLSYEGAAPVVVELVSGEANQAVPQPIVRIARKSDLSHDGTSKVVSGHLLVQVLGRNSPVRIPMFVQLSD